MSRENLQRLVEAYAAFNKGDRSSVLELLAPDFVYRPRSELPGNQPTVGRDQFQRLLQEFSEVFASARFELEEVIDLDDHIVAVIRQTAHGSSSGLPVDQHLAHMWTVEDGRATALRVFTSREDALEAVGLRE